MRVTFGAMNRDITSAIDKAAERLRDLQQQVATTKRIQRPSDDPSAAAAATLERSRLAAVDRYDATADSAKSRLTVADTALSGIIDQLSAAEVTVIAARGTMLNASQREAKALELAQLRDAVMTGLNTSFNGTYLFGGAAATVRPYAKDNAGVVSAYQGSNTEVAVDINHDVAIAVTFDGEQIAHGSDTDDIFTVFERAIAAARSGDTDELNTVAADLKRAFTRATSMQSRVGAALRAVDEGEARLDETSRGIKAQISALEDANMAAAITGMTQAETVYRAALQSAAGMHRLSLMDYLK